MEIHDVEGLSVSQTDGTVRILLDRPDRANAMTSSMVGGLRRLIAEAAAADNVRVMVVTGRGRHFCSGIDLAGPATSGTRPRAGHLQRGIHHGAHALLRELTELQVPVVAGVRGSAAGFGLSLALACDYVVAAHDARFWAPFVARGFSPDSGTTFLLPRLVGVARAREMLLLGRPVDGEQAATWGLVNEAVGAESVEAAMERVVSEFASAATVAVGLGKVLLARALGGDLDDALAAEELAEEVSVRSDDFKEGTRAFLERREPRYLGR